MVFETWHKRRNSIEVGGSNRFRTNWAVSELSVPPVQAQRIKQEMNGNYKNEVRMHNVSEHKVTESKTRMEAHIYELQGCLEEAPEQEPLSCQANEAPQMTHKWDETEVLLKNSISKLDKQQDAWKKFISGQRN